MQDELLRELEEHSGSDLFTLSVATEDVSFSDESGANDVSQENDELQVYVTQDHMLRMLHEQSQNVSLTLSVLRENVVLDQRFDLHSGSTEDARRIEVFLREQGVRSLWSSRLMSRHLSRASARAHRVRRLLR